MDGGSRRPFLAETRIHAVASRLVSTACQFPCYWSLAKQSGAKPAGYERQAAGARPTWSTNVARALNNGFQQCHHPPRHLCHQSLHACPLVVSNKRGNVESESWKGRALSKAATWWLLRSTPPGLDLTNHAAKCQNANSEKETGNCSTCKLLIKPRSHVVTNVA